MKYSSVLLNKLIEHFASLPGIGTKSAAKMAFYILDIEDARAKDFAETILKARSSIKKCTVCQTLTEDSVCAICGSERRDKSTICIVESPKDVISIERTKIYHGSYHVLHGLLSPINGITPDDITVKQLITRLDESVSEVILALSPNVDGEATAMYISRLIKPFGIEVSRLASGLPVGGELEYTDSITLQKAIEFRVGV
jgi:recombination protein RecR